LGGVKDRVPQEKRGKKEKEEKKKGRKRIPKTKRKKKSANRCDSTGNGKRRTNQY